MSLTASFPEVWAKEQQLVFYKENVAKVLAEMKFKSELSSGDTFSRVKRTEDSTVYEYVRGSDMTFEDIATTKEQLVVNKEFYKSFYIDDFNKIQSNYEEAANFGRDNGEYLSNQVDADFLGEVVNADLSVDAADVGGTAGNGIDTTTSNVLKMFSAIRRKLRKNNISTSRWYGVISPEIEEVILQYLANKNTTLGDDKSENGKFMKFLGFDLYVSNQLTSSAVLALATQPTDGDTVTVNGIVYTYKTTLGSTPGNVLIGASADAARANLAAAVNRGAGAGSTYVAFTSTSTEYRKQANMTATNDDTANTLLVVNRGVGVITVSETLTAGADIWGTYKQHLQFGQKGAVTMIIQEDASPEIKDHPFRKGKNVLNAVLYGLKTYTDGAKRLVDVQVDAEAFVA
jgi:hypothetical protein